MFKVEIKFKDGLKNADDYEAAVDKIFAAKNMPCIERRRGYRVYGDNGDPKDIGRLYDCVGDVSDEDWLFSSVAEAKFDNGYKVLNLMNSFFAIDARG